MLFSLDQVLEESFSATWLEHHCFQMTFVARDNGNPTRDSSNTATGTINIYRNDFAPSIGSENYIIFISEETAQDVVIFNVNATDADAPVSVVIFLGVQVIIWLK